MDRSPQYLYYLPTKWFLAWGELDVCVVGSVPCAAVCAAAADGQESQIP